MTARRSMLSPTALTLKLLSELLHLNARVDAHLERLA